jgi:hypothetical protein
MNVQTWRRLRVAEDWALTLAGLVLVGLALSGVLPGLAP